MSINAQPLSVLHVVSYFPPDRVGGVGEHVRLIHEGHLNLGLDSEVLTSGVTNSDPRVHRIGRTPIAFVLNSWRRANLAKGRDLIHAHHGEGLLTLLLMRARRDRPRILVMFHVDVRLRERASRVHRFEGVRYGPKGVRLLARVFGTFVKALFERAVWILADHIVVETKAVRSELADMRPRRQISVVSHGLGPSKAVMPETSISPVELLYVGTAGIRKRTHLLPFILHRVRQQVPNACLRIVGFDVDGDPYLREQAERLGVLSAIDFAGSVRSEEVIPHYRSATVLLLPSAYEGLPMVLLEAMREGLVPVATAVSGHPEAIEGGVNGHLVDLDDIAAMASCCIRLLRDPITREEMAQRARQTLLMQFTIDRELEAYIERYRALVGPAT